MAATWKEKWEAMPPKRRHQITLAGGGMAILLIAFMVLSAQPAGTSQQGAAGKIENVLGREEDLSGMTIAGISSDVQSFETRLRQIESENERLRDELTKEQTTGSAGIDQRLQSELQQMRQQIDAMQRSAGTTGAPGNPAAPPTPSANGGPMNPATPAGQPGAPGMQGPPPPPPAYGGIRTIQAEPPARPSKPVTNAQADTKPETFYLPAGSMITGVLLAGVDAPSGQRGSRDPIPVLARVKRDAVLPSRYRADVKECFLLLEAMADLSSERAMMRSTTLSCIKRDKSVIEVPIAGYAVGEDGRAGLRGEVIDKRGRVIGYALLAGFTQAAGQAIGGQNNNGLQVGQNGQLDLSQAGNQTLAGGTGSALDRIAQWFIERADSLFPVVEIEAGRRVTVVVLKGMEMATVTGTGDRGVTSRHR
jgi:conjugal transfer pilus assembly protein TraB